VRPLSDPKQYVDIWAPLCEGHFLPTRLVSIPPAALPCARRLMTWLGGRSARQNPPNGKGFSRMLSGSHLLVAAGIGFAGFRASPWSAFTFLFQDTKSLLDAHVLLEAHSGSSQGCQQWKPSHGKDAGLQSTLLTLTS